MESAPTDRLGHNTHTRHGLTDLPPRPPHLPPKTQAAQEAALRPLVYCLRAYPYWGLRLTSAETATHLHRFALAAGSHRIAALAAAYHTHLAAHERNYTLIAPVPLAWLRARPLALDAPEAIVLAFDRRPPPRHESSPNLVLALRDAVGRQPFEEPEAGESGESGEEGGGGGGGYGNGCLRLPTTGAVGAEGCVVGVFLGCWGVWWV